MLYLLQSLDSGKSLFRNIYTRFFGIIVFLIVLKCIVLSFMIPNQTSSPIGWISYYQSILNKSGNEHLVDSENGDLVRIGRGFVKKSNIYFKR